jgi:uncharacterized coiled-coil DUF342 family protein
MADNVQIRLLVDAGKGISSIKKFGDKLLGLSKESNKSQQGLAKLKDELKKAENNLYLASQKSGTTSREFSELASKANLAAKKLKIVEHNAEGAEKDIGRLGKTTDSGISKLGKYAMGLVSLGYAFSKANESIRLASNMIETQNKFDQVFKSLSKDAARWAEAYAEDMGFSVLKTKEAMGDIQNLFTGFDMGRKKSAEMSKEIVSLANDLDSFNNLTDRGVDVQQTMISALMGESEAAKTLGASILEPQMEIAALAMGYDKYSNKMDEATKIQIRLKAITMQSKDAIGDVARNLDTEVGKRRRLNAEIENTKIKIGTGLMPLQMKFLESSLKLVEVINKNSDSFTKLGETLINNGAAIFEAGKAFAVTFGILKGYSVIATVISLYQQAAVAQKGLTVTQWLLNAAMNANPVGAIVIGVSALVASIAYLIQKWKEMKKQLASGVAMKGITKILGAIYKFSGGTEETAEENYSRWGKYKEQRQKSFAGKESLTSENNGRVAIFSRADQTIDGSHRTGIGYVPKDNYNAMLHRGERVLTAGENKNYNSDDASIREKGGNIITVNIGKIFENLNIKDVSDAAINKITDKVAWAIVNKTKLALGNV